MTEIKIIFDGKRCRVVDNCNLKKGKAYKPIFDGNVDDCINFLKEKGTFKKV